MKKDFDLLSMGEILLRLSPPNNERIVRGETFQKQVGGAELNVVSGVSLLGLRTGSFPSFRQIRWEPMRKTVSASAGSATTIWFMTMTRTPVLEFIIMKMGLIRENQV